MTPRAAHLTVILVALSVLTLGACGSSEDEAEGEPLPGSAVATLQTRLDEIERRYQDAVDNGNVGACNDIGTDSIPAIEEVLAGLPNDVDPELRNAVDRSFARLQELADSECSEIEPEPEPLPEPVPEPEPEPIPEETIPEETVPSETTPLEPPSDDEEDKDEEKDKDKNKDKEVGGPPPGQGGGGIGVPPGLENDG